jgi:hypothetical protein
MAQELCTVENLTYITAETVCVLLKMFELKLRGIRRTSKRYEACRLPFIASREARRHHSNPNNGGLTP